MEGAFCLGKKAGRGLLNSWGVWLHVSIALSLASANSLARHLLEGSLSQLGLITDLKIAMLVERKSGSIC